MNFGSEMKAARKAAQFNQTEAGLFIYKRSKEKGQVQISNIEQRFSFPTPKVFEKCKLLCKEYKIPIGVIIINSLSLEDFEMSEESFNDMKNELQKVLESYISGS